MTPMRDYLSCAQAWNAFGDLPSPAQHGPGPVDVDGLERSQVDMLFQDADWNQDGR